MSGMSRLTNIYYAQYDSSIESVAYDSDNSDTYRKLMELSSQAEFCKYIKRRRNEELLHESWKFAIREQTNLAKQIEEQCGMAVELKDNRIQYIYKRDINETLHIPGIKFKITFVYIKLLRKWYISLGHCHLPDVININKIKRGIYDPTRPKILKLVHQVKNLLDIHVQRLEYIYNVIDNMKDNYKDMEFQINKSLTNIKIILKEKAWPRSIEKTSSKNIIILEMTLDENMKTDNLSYTYVYDKGVQAQQKRMCILKLEQKLQILFDFPLMEALNIFMNEASSSS